MTKWRGRRRGRTYTPDHVEQSRCWVSALVKADTVGIELPADFPGRVYNRVHNRVTEWWGHKPQDHRHPHWAGGWNAVAYRFVGADDAEATYRTSVARHGSAPVPEERLAQEKAIFAFYISACSCLESFVFAVYALAGLVEPTRFLLDTEERAGGVGVHSLVDGLRAAFPGDALVSAVTSEILDPYRAKEPMWGWRHVLTHRAVPSRDFYRGGPNQDAWSGAPHGLPNTPVTPVALADERKLLSERLARLLTSTDEFLDRRAVP